MNTKLKLLFIPHPLLGPINGCIGAGQVLSDNGHEINFLVSEQWRGKLAHYGFQEILYKDEEMATDANPVDHFADSYVKSGWISDLPSIEKQVIMGKTITKERNRFYKRLDQIIEDILKTKRLDIIFVNIFQCIPSVETSGIPWVWIRSGGPLFMHTSDLLPPWASGFSIFSDQNEWKKFRDVVNDANNESWNEWNHFVVSKGGKPLEKRGKYINGSEYLNIYSYPLELDYSDVCPLPNNYIRFDNLKRMEKQINFEIPPELVNKSGKLIYFSMGSLGGADIQMMKRLISILSLSPHRYIVSKGPLHRDYELPPNMWGEKIVPQIQVLPIVDLVITHGGNNTLTESFYFGKPLIVLPLFIDQYDNAQRVEDKEFGIRLDPYRCTEEVLLKSIESLLNDKELNEKLMKISKRIQTENSIEKLPEIVKRLVKY